jgi:hypothetical protein
MIKSIKTKMFFYNLFIDMSIGFLIYDFLARFEINSAIIDTAISTGSCVPISIPMGACMRFIRS